MKAIFEKELPDGKLCKPHFFERKKYTTTRDLLFQRSQFCFYETR